MFLSISKTKIVIVANLSSAIAFNLDQSRFLLCGKGLNWGLCDKENCAGYKDFLTFLQCLASFFPKVGQAQDCLLNPIPNKPWFLRVCHRSLLKTPWEKEKLLVTSNFTFSNSVFYLFEELSAIFNKGETVVCKLFQFG